MTAEELAKLEALANAATAGPWEHDLDQFDDSCICACVSNAGVDLLFTNETGCGGHERIGYKDGDKWTLEHQVKHDGEWKKARDGQELKDAAFIAATRTAVPELIAEVLRLADENRALRDALKTIGRTVADPLPHSSSECRGLLKAVRLDVEGALSATTPEKP